MAVGDGFHVDTNGNLWLGSTRETFDSTTRSEAKFYVEADGTMVAKAGASFAGDLSAAGGTFSGNLSAAGGTFTGTLSGVDGTFTGTISASNVTGGTLDFTSVTAGNLDFSSLSVTSTQIINTIATDAILGKISDGAISEAKLGNLSASKITSGTIDAALINTASLASVFINTSANITSALTVQGATVKATGDLQTGDRIEHVGDESDSYIDIGSNTTHYFRVNGGNTGLQLSGTGSSFVYSDWRPSPAATHNLGSSFSTWDAVFAVDTSINTSDITLKTDIENTTLGLDFLNTLEPIEFKWKDGGVRTHLGFSAQDVKQKLIDAKGESQNYAIYTQGSYETYDEVDEDGNLVEQPPEGWEKYGLRMSELIPILVKSIQELTARIEELEA